MSGSSTRLGSGNTGTSPENSREHALGVEGGEPSAMGEVYRVRGAAARRRGSMAGWTARRLSELLAAVKRGDLDVDAAAERIAAATHGRAPASPRAAARPRRRSWTTTARMRCGFPEVVYAPGKTPGDLVRIAHEILGALASASS